MEIVAHVATVRNEERDVDLRVVTADLVVPAGWRGWLGFVKPDSAGFRAVAGPASEVVLDLADAGEWHVFLHDGGELVAETRLTVPAA